MAFLLLVSLAPLCEAFVVRHGLSGARVLTSPMSPLYYGDKDDASGKSMGDSSPSSFSWAAVTSTEKWLSNAVPDSHLRKEVSYACEAGAATGKSCPL